MTYPYLKTTNGLEKSQEIVETFRRKYKLALSDTKCKIIIKYPRRQNNRMEDRSNKCTNNRPLYLPMLPNGLDKTGSPKRHISIKKTRVAATTHNILCPTKA